jgi:hypothetical protein
MKHQWITVPAPANELSSPTWLIAIPFFALGWVFSLWYLNAYYAGDSIFYTRFYDALYDLPIEYWGRFQRIHLGSSEPIYRYVVGFGAYNGWDRIYYLSVWNGAFIAAIGYTLVKYRCSVIFSALVLTNFYVLTLLGSAERLRFAYLMLVLAFTIENRSLKFALAASSPFFHTQAAIQFASGFGYYLTANLQKFARTPLRTLMLAIVAAIAVAGIAYLFVSTVGQSVESKSAYYAGESTGLTEAIQWGLLLAVGLYVFKEKAAFLVAMMPMGVLTIMFGNRVNVATFALFAALAIMRRKTSNPLVLAVMGYMSFKSVGFLLNVVQFGDGFAGGG